MHATASLPPLLMVLLVMLPRLQSSVIINSAGSGCCPHCRYLCCLVTPHRAPAMTSASSRYEAPNHVQSPE